MYSRLSVFFLFVAFIFSVTQPAAAQSPVMYLPALEAVDGTDLGLALLNSGSTDAQVTLTARTYDGVLISSASVVNPTTLTVPGSGKLEMRVSDVFGNGIWNQRGWVEIRSSAWNVKAFSFLFDAPMTFVEGVNVASDTSGQLVFPKISTRAGTVLNVVNVSGQPVDTTISIFDNSGNPAGMIPVPLAAFSGLTRSVGELLPAVSDFEGYAIVQTGVSSPFAAPVLVGFERYRNQSDFAVIRGVPVSAGARNGYWPHFGAEGGYTSRITLVNTADTTQVLQITADAMPGTASATRTLLPHQKIEERLADMFGFPSSNLVTGDLRFESQTGTSGVIGVLEYGTADGRSLSAAESQPQAQGDFYFPHLAAGTGYYTGLAMQNPSATVSTVMLDLYDRFGALKASSSLDLNPGEHKASVIDSFFQQTINQLGGYIHVTAGQPVFAQEILGSSNSTDFLANVPPQSGVSSDLYTAAASTTNPVPSIASITPQSALIDNLRSLNVRISGTGFTRGSDVLFDGMGMKTNFVSSVLLAITLGGSRLTAGVHTIQVSNSAPGGGLSNTVKLLLANGSYPANQAPAVNAGSNQTITLPSSATLSGSATDDGLPLNGSLSTTWSQVSGPGSVNFGNAGSPATTAAFSASGSYTLRLTGNDGALSSTSDVTITVNAPSVAPPPPSPTNQAPVVSAGSNQTITLPSSANLSGTATDDGLPSGTLTTTWSMSSGPGTVTFVNVSALSTTAGFSTSGTYVLQLAASDTALTSTSVVTIVVNPAPAPTPTPTPTPTGNTYYVSNSGSDSNSGTSQSSPWKTIAKVQNSLGNLKPGDSVLFQRGGIWYEELDVNNVNGQSGLPITFGNYGSGNQPIIDGGGAVSGYTVNGGRQWCIGGQSSKMSYLTIDGFECRNTSSYGIAFVGVSAGSVGIVVQNSYIHHTGNGDTGYHNQLMFAEYNYGHAYGTKFLNNKVGDCYGHNCIQIHGDTGSPLIQGNECYNFSHNCIDVKYTQGAVVDSNVVHDGLGNQQYENAFYHQNETTSYTGSVTWTHNVVYGSNVTTAFQCEDAGGAVSCKVYNNTVYGSMTGVFGGSFSGSYSNIQIDAKNNIFDTPAAQRGGGYAAWDYNDTVQSTPIGAHDVRVNPMYVNAGGHDFHLQSGSPVIDKGVNVSLPFAGSAPDLGAFEYGL